MVSPGLTCPMYTAKNRVRRMQGKKTAYSCLWEFVTACGVETRDDFPEPSRSWAFSQQ